MEARLAGWFKAKTELKPAVRPEKEPPREPPQADLSRETISGG